MLPTGPGSAPFAVREIERQLCSWKMRTSTNACASRRREPRVVERAAFEREPPQLVEELRVDRRAGGGSRPARA